MNNILYFKPQPPKEDEIDFNISIKSKYEEESNYIYISHRTDIESLPWFIGITTSDFNKIMMMKTIALQHLKNDLETILQEGNATYYM